MIPNRGAATNPANRFEALHLERDAWSADDPLPATQLLLDSSRSIISHNDSPDVGFDASINAYRGCEHGCIYCYARPTHEYLGFSAGLDFETRILAKPDAPALLRAELSARNYVPEPLAMSGVTDPYQPAERRLRITRGMLEVLLECRHPVSLITKSQLIVRDIDVLAPLAALNAAHATISITTLDRDLQRAMEPRAASPDRRLDAVRQLSSAGIPVGVNVAPVIPGLTDHEMPAILEAAKDAGAMRASYIIVRLPYGVKDLFADWLQSYAPARRGKVLHRLRELRGGKLNSPEFGERMRGNGVFADQLRTMFNLTVRRLGLDRPWPALTTAHFRKPPGEQLDIFQG